MNEENKLSMAEFQPAEATLRTLADKAKSVDTTNIALVHDTRIELRDTRIALTKKGKELRDGALQFQKAVIKKEKDLLAIITPEEERLDAIEMADKQKKEMELRRSELPSRKAALESIADGIIVSDDFLLSIDDNDFNTYRLERISNKLEVDRMAHAKKVQAEEDAARARRAEEDRIAREKLDVEKAEFEKQKKAEDDKRRAEQAEIDKEKARLAGIEEQRQREEAVKKAELERQEKEAALKKQAEADALAKAEKEKKDQESKAEYRAWLESIKFDPATCILNTVGDKVTAFREIGTYTLKK